MTLIDPLPLLFTEAHGSVGAAFEYQILASDAEKYSATELPPGLDLDEDTGIISGTPTEAGTFRVELSAENDVGESVCGALLTIHIREGGPVITSPLTAVGTQAEPFTYTISATGTGTITFNATDMPTGLSIDHTTGEISGTPMVESGIWSFPISATDDNGTTTETLELTLQAGAPPPPIPIITSPDTASGTAGVPFTYIITAHNIPTSFYATGLPNGLAVNTNTGSILGVPTEIGTFEVTLSATNANGTGTAILTIIIGEAPERPCPPPPPRKVLSGPDVPDIHCYVPDGCCGPDICLIGLEDLICQIRSLLPEGEIFNTTLKPQKEPTPPNVGAITAG
jgi:PKD repeat protein